MALRPLEWPRDLTPLGEMICERFQYSESPHWSVQTDKKKGIPQLSRGNCCYQRRC